MNKIIFICFLAAVAVQLACGFLVRSKEYEEKKAAILKLADTLEIRFEKEFQKFMQTGVRSDKLKSFYASLQIPEEARDIEDIEDFPEEYARVTCLACRAGATTVINAFRRGADEPTLNRMAFELCVNLNLQTATVCQGLVNFNIRSLMYIGAERPQLDSTSVCSIVLHGECGNIPAGLDFRINVDQSAAPITEPKVNPPPGTKKELKIVHFSDLHHQPTYVAGAERNCLEPVCCMTDSTLGQGQVSQRAGVWGDFRCGVPWRAAEVAVSHMADNHDVDLVYYTGDTVDHSIWKTSIQYNMDIIDRVNNLLKEKFPNTPVYVAIGNHEAHPTNLFPPNNITAPGLTINWLYENLANSMSKWLPPSALQTLRLGGYYTVQVKPGLRLAVINNNECYTFNWWLQYEQVTKARQLQWLHDLLLNAERFGDKVHIVAHMPSSKRSCYQFWSREFRRIIDRFRNTIAAQFNGHTHRDEFFIFYDRDRFSLANNVAWNGGSVVTRTNLNPNYKVYSVDGDNFHVNNFESWIFNLTDANLNPNRNPNWFKLYSFKEAFGLPDLSPATLNTLAFNMARNPSQLLQMYQFKHKMSDPFVNRGCDRACQRTTLCDIVVNEMGDNRVCNQLVALLA